MERMHKGKALSKKELEELDQYENPKEKQIEEHPGIVRTIPQLAAALGRTDRTIRYWIPEGMPIREDKKYDIEEIRKWRSDRDNRTPNPQDEISQRIREAQLQTVEFKNNQIQGLYITREEARKAGFETARKTRDAMLSIPNRISDMLASISDGTKVHEILTDEITIALENLTERGNQNGAI